MIRRIGYRTALTAFVFTGLWFLIGLLLLSSPLPGALGISGALFTVWLLLFLAILALAGLTLLIAAINGLFPPNVRAPRRADDWVAADTTLPARRSVTTGPRTSRPPHRG